MLALFRRFLNTWAARAFFLVLVGSFGLWGVADVVRNVGHDGTTVATVGDEKVGVPEMQAAFRRNLSETARMLGNRTEPTPEIRRAVAQQTLQQLITRAALMDEARSLGLSVPDDALRQAVWDMDAFKDPDGRFSRGQLDAVLRSNGLTEARLLELVRADQTLAQLIGPVRAGASSPDVLTREVFDYSGETRVAELVELDLAAAPDPPAPDDAALHRFFDNNPDRYSTPAYRRIKAVVLSPDTIARDVQVSEDDVRAAYEQHRTEYVTPEKRAAQVLVSQDEAKAAALANEWRAGADWARMEQAAKDAGVASVALEDSAAAEFPSPDLARAVFAASPDAVTGPVRTELGFQVFRVTHVVPGTERTLAQAHDELRDRVARERAADQIYARAQTLEDALGGGTSLDDLPGDLGLRGIAGTLDAAGKTPSGEPAPLPGPPALAQAIVASAFQARKGEPPRLTEGPDQSYYALSVEDVIPAAVRPYDEVAERVRDDWTRDQRRHEQEQVAAKLLTAVQGGQSLGDVATIAGLRVDRTAPITRAAPPEGVPAQLVPPLFALKRGDATMVETPTGFVVAALRDITEPDPAADPVGYGRARDGMTRSVAEDLELTLAGALRDRARPTVNRQLFDAVVQQ